MLIYIGLLLFVSLWIWFEKISLNRRAFFIPCAALIMVATFRNYTIGTDTPNYTQFFRGSISLDNYIFDPRVEFGYQLFEYFILHISKEYYVLFLVSSLIIIPSILYTIRKYSVNYLISVYIYISFSFYTLLFNTLRQAIAMAICMLGMYFFINKKIVPYFFIVFLASTFHISAWIMLVIYFLVHYINVKIELKVILSFLISFLGAKIIIDFMASDNDRYVQYTQQSENAGGYLTILLYIGLAIFVYLSGKKVRKENNLFKVLEQTFILGLALVIPIVLLGTNPSGPQRLLYYTSVYVIFLLPILLNVYKNILLNSLFLLFSGIYFYLVTMKLYEIYPYILNPIFNIF